MADPDDLAVKNLRRNRRRKKCRACKGSGHVMKYIRPGLIDLVTCIPCRGTGRPRGG